MTPLRALSDEILAREAAFVPAQPAVQRILPVGGWGWGDAAFEAPNPPAAAQIVYYQKKRHIFGDFKLEVFDPDGKLLTTLPTSKRRGLSRASWSMRVKPPRVPPAATLAYGANNGPRVLPGTYTVKMTKDKAVYETKLEIVADPRSKHTPEDRKAQFDLAMKLYGMLGDMSFAVERINALRAGSRRARREAPRRRRARGPPPKASADLDVLRQKIVATKEGGMITGEERLREYLTDLYGNVHRLRGPPHGDAGPADRRARPRARRRRQGVRRLGGEGAARDQPGARGEGAAEGGAPDPRGLGEGRSRVRRLVSGSRERVGRRSIRGAPPDLRRFGRGRRTAGGRRRGGRGGAFGSGARRNGDQFAPESTVFRTPRCVPAYSTDGARGSRDSALT